jgi:hypothetical protein
MDSRTKAPASILASLALVVGVAAAARAQVYDVDSNGAGDFVDLQTALDTVPAGSTLLVHGEQWCQRYFVEKSVTIVGLKIQGSISGDGFDNAILEVDAGPGSRVVFDHLSIQLIPGWTWEGTNGINVWSAGDVVISNSFIECSSAMATSCESYSRNGDGVVIHDADSVSILGSSIAGGSGWVIWSGCDEGCDYMPNVRPRGGHGVLVNGPLGLLLVEDSLVQGGLGCEIGFNCTNCHEPPGAPRGGDGGNAIAGNAFLSNCELVGGKGARGWSWGCDPPLEDWGADGVEVAGSRVELADALSVGEAVLGKDLALVGRGFAPDHAAILFLGTALGDPIVIRQGTWFLAWPFTFLGPFATDATGGFFVHGELPNDPTFSGVTLVLQASDGKLLSEPEVAVVRPTL